MARVPEAEIERLKAEVPLASLAEAAGVVLVRTGADLTGRCPFHEDDNPSLVISPGKNLWHCLGACQAGGSVIDWVMRAEGVSFRHAVELLRGGVPAVGSGTAPKRSTVRRLAPPVCGRPPTTSCWGRSSIPPTGCWGSRRTRFPPWPAAGSITRRRSMCSGSATRTGRWGCGCRTSAARHPRA